MRVSVFALTLLVAQIPNYNPAGIWESETGVEYQILQNGADLQVKLVPGSNTKYLQYDVSLKKQDEINTYKGTGTFTAKMEGGKECKFDTEWLLVIVSPARMFGTTTGIQADKKTCVVKEKSQEPVDLKKKK